MEEPEEGSTGLRRRIGLVLAPALLVALWAAPLPLDPRAHHLAAIFAAVVVAWTTEAIPVAATSLLIGPALVVAGISGAKDAFAPYADPILFIFVGGFFIAAAMHRHGLDRRIARAVVSIPWLAASPRRSRAGFMLAALAISMWTSNTATMALLLPILIGDRASRRDGSPPDTEGEARRRGLSGDVLALSFACSVGGLGTVVGSPPNLITARFLREAVGSFGFVDWLKIGLPSACVFLVLGEIAIHRLAPATTWTMRGEDAKPWSRGERVTAVAFGLAVVGWLVPGILQASDLSIAPRVSAHLDPGAVAMFASLPLFVFHDGERRPILPWRDANRIDWGVIMLFGGGIALGTAMTETGLASTLGQAFVQSTGIQSMWTLTLTGIVATIVLSEACSNTATANMLVPLMIAAAASLGLPPHVPALAVGVAASCGFMLPIATGPNALAYGTGVVPQREMIRIGFVLDLVCAAALIGIVVLLAPG